MVIPQIIVVSQVQQYVWLQQAHGSILKLTIELCLSVATTSKKLSSYTTSFKQLVVSKKLKSYTTSFMAAGYQQEA